MIDMSIRTSESAKTLKLLAVGSNITASYFNGVMRKGFVGPSVVGMPL